MPGGAWRLAADGALALILAPACAACGTPLEHPTSGPVCAACWDAIVPITPPCCRTCGEPLPSWRILSVTESRCARCRRGASLLAQAQSLGRYDGSLRRILQAFKYEGRRTLAMPLATRMRAACAGVLDGADAAVPVPLHPSRLRARGFNQAAALAEHLGLPVVHALRRARRTATQADLPSSKRHSNVRGAFALAEPRLLARVGGWVGYHVGGRGAESVRDRVIVLVDDVATTGATLNACAEALLGAGAVEVRAVTAARAVVRRR